MNASPLVSVGIPTYNRPSLLRSRLINVLSQTYRNLNVIVSDNASTDPEVERVCLEFAALDRRVRYIKRETNIGAPANFSYVVTLAVSDFFVWAADDDEWEPDFVERCVNGIGDAQLFCLGMELKYLRTGKTEGLDLPDLNAVDGVDVNLPKFLANTQPNMVYGLHRLDALKSFMIKNVNFDLWDVALLYDAVVNRGITVQPGVGYRAGIPGDSYAVWTFGKPGSEQKFHYGRFLRSLAGSTKRASGVVGAMHRARVGYQALSMAIDLISHLTKTFPDKARFSHRIVSEAKIPQRAASWRYRWWLVRRKVRSLTE